MDDGGCRRRRKRSRPTAWGGQGDVRGPVTMPRRKVCSCHPHTTSAQLKATYAAAGVVREALCTNPTMAAMVSALKTAKRTRDLPSQTSFKMTAVLSHQNARTKSAAKACLVHGPPTSWARAELPSEVRS